MQKTATIKLPFPVSVNAMYSVKGRTKTLSKRARAWKTEAGLEIMAQRPNKFAGPVKIMMTYTPPDNRRRDADNFVKIVLDSLVSANVIEDDNTQIIRDRREIWNEPDKSKAGVVIEIKEYSVC